MGSNETIVARHALCLKFGLKFVILSSLKTPNPLDRIIAQLREAFVSELAQAVSLKGADKVRYKEKVVESDSERFVGRGNL